MKRKHLISTVFFISLGFLQGTAYAEVDLNNPTVLDAKTPPPTTLPPPDYFDSSVNPTQLESSTPPPSSLAAPATQEVPDLAPSSIVIRSTPNQNIDCRYRIPANSNNIDDAIVLRWSEKAVMQSFTFSHVAIDTQLTELQACYTEQGWQGFKSALAKSGNVGAIKTQGLIVSSRLLAPAHLTKTRENQWKVTVPIEVIYQNDKEKITQSLTINMVVGRKMSGDLGIMQLIALPV